MWFCTRCKRECSDKYIVCPDCGTSRPEIKEVLEPWICENCKKFYVAKMERWTVPGFEWYQAARKDKKVQYKKELYTNYCPYCGKPRSGQSEYKRSSEPAQLSESESVTTNRQDQGQFMTMGLYDQGNGMKPIEWIDITPKKNTDYQLLLSRYVLDVKAFHSDLNSVTWRESSIRKWLNKEFVKLAFSEKERSKIQPVIPYSFAVPQYNKQERGKMNPVPPLQASQDQVFLLSSWEVKEYLQSPKIRMADPTISSIGQGVVGRNGMLYSSLLRTNEVRGEGCYWWLRDSGFRDDYACFVNEEGEVDGYGDFCVNNTIGIRPAMWIKASTDDPQA